MARFPERRHGLLVAVTAAATLLAFADARPDSGQNSRTPACPLEATPASGSTMIATVAMPANGLILGRSRVSLPLTAPQDRAATERLAAYTRSGSGSVILRLSCVEADRPPHATWEVYVGLPAKAEPNAESPHFVGNVALFGDGIRSESKRNAFAEFVFPLDRAIQASHGVPALTVTFVPSAGIVVDGRPAPVDVQAPVRIGAMDLLLDNPAGQR